MIDEAKRWETYSQVLSAKGIRLSYSEAASTASYDLLTHEVVLPMWDCLDEDATQALTSHEIGHAKFSDYELEAFKDLFARYKDLFNVVEDARIERLMKKEFQGLGQIFRDGYATMANGGVFPLDDVDKASLVERLNIFAKFGFMVEVPFFNKDESSFAFRLMNLSTKTDVVDLCEDIHAYLENVAESLASQNDELKASENEEPLDGQDGLEGMMDDSSESLVSNEGSRSDSKHEQSRSRQSNEDGKEGNSPLDSLLQDGRTRQFAQTIEQMHMEERDSNPSNKPIVVRSKDVLEETYMKIDKDFIKGFEEGSKGKRNRKRLLEIVEKAAADAAALFSQKKSALENASKHRMHCGRIDPKKLARHSVSDAIFKVMEKLPKGKSHGVVLLLDLSISMCRNKDIQRCACLQAAILGRFCQIVGIDFSIIAFGCDLSAGWNRSNRKIVAKLADFSSFNLNFLVSVATMNSSDAIKVKEDEGGFGWISPGGNTPTLEALLAAREEVKAMRCKGVEKAAIIISTDGGYSIDIHSINDERINVSGATRMLLDGKPFEISDIKGMDKARVDQAKDWGFELMVGYIRKETGASIIFSSIGDEYVITLARDIWKGVEVEADNGVRHRVGWKAFEPYMFKHMYLFGQSIKGINFSEEFSRPCFGMSIRNDSIIDRYMVMNSSRVYVENAGRKAFEGLNSNEIAEKLVCANRTLDACKAFAKAFVEFFS